MTSQTLDYMLIRLENNKPAERWRFAMYNNEYHQT